MTFLEQVKKRSIILLAILFLLYITYSTYTDCIKDVKYLAKSRSIVYFAWQSVPLLLIKPSAVYFVILLLSGMLSRKLAPHKMLVKGMTIALGYMGLALIVGFVLSIVLIIHPLGTNYILCQGGGPLSGAFYTKNKNICEQLKLARKVGGIREVEKLNDRLDSIPLH